MDSAKSGTLGILLPCSQLAFLGKEKESEALSVLVVPRGYVLQQVQRLST